MSTLAEFMIVAGADNRPPMLDKPQYESWKFRMELYIQENGIVRPKTYEELSDKEKLQADCNLKATNIVLQGLPSDVYALVNHHKIAKDIWDRVKLLMQGTSLSKQERECKLYNEFDKFSYVKGETLHQYYLWFAQLINDMNIIQMNMQPVQVNTKFLNSLLPEWGKFVTNVKLARDLHTTNYDQLYDYLEQHEVHANETRLMRLVVPLFLPSDDPIACMNKAMAFLSAVFTPRYPSTNNQLRSSSNMRNQATVQDGRITVQQVQGRQGQNVVSLCSQGNVLGSRGNTSGQAKVIKCYNYQGEGHMARECTHPKRRRDATWFKEKVLLIQAQARGKELDEEQLAFLADHRVADGQVAQTITHNAALQTDDLDAYDSDCDDICLAKAVLMANLSSCDSYVLSEDKANNESKIVNESLTVELERYKERVKFIEQRFNVDLSSHEKFIYSQMDDMIRTKNTKFAAIKTEIDTLKQTLSKHVKEKESLLTTLNGFKMEFKERESKSIDKEIVLENKIKELENIVSLGYQNPFYLKRAQEIKPILYDGNVLSNTHDVLSMVDKEETLILAEESRLKMVEKQNDPIMKKEKINITPVNYFELNKLAEILNLKGKNVIDTDVSKHYATTIAPGMFKLNLEPLAPKVLKNKYAHLEYIKHSREHTDILREIVESIRELSPLDSKLDSAFSHGVKFLRSKDEAREFIIKFLKMIQVRSNAIVRSIHTDNGTEFVNQTLRSYYEEVGISHETSVARTTPQQNDVVERQNHTYSLVRRLARTKLIYVNFHYTSWQNQLHTPASLCYPTNDSEDLGKLKAKADVGIFIG
ncbi:putative reverse transcriptase domain-containing protein [Tanacetum coccineum]